MFFFFHTFERSFASKTCIFIIFVCVQYHLNSLFFFSLKCFLEPFKFSVARVEPLSSWCYQSGSRHHRGVRVRVCVSVSQRSATAAAVHHVSPVLGRSVLRAPGSVMDLTASNCATEPLFSRPQSHKPPKSGTTGTRDWLRGISGNT